MGEPYYINQRKIMKFLKKGLKIIIKNPKVLIDENSRNISPFRSYAWGK